MGVQQSILQAFNGSPASTPVRFIKVSIQDEQAVLATSVPPRGSVKEDFALIEENAQISITEPCYLLYRLDGNNAWLFITYVPDAAKVRDKMLYSSSKSRLVKALGETNFTDTIHATSPSDLTPRAYELHLAALAAPKPLTEKEKAMAEVRAAEYEASKEGSMRGTGGGVRGGAGPLSGVMGVGKGLVWAEGIEQALEGLKQDGKLVGLTIDPKSPTNLTLAVNESSTLALFHTHLPPSSPQYTFFSYRPTDASAESTPIVLFVYTCPPKSPIKMRMIYSSSVGSLVANVKTKVGIEVGKKIESSEPDSLTESELLSEIKPLISTNPIRSFSVPTPAPTRPSGVAPNAFASSFSGSTTESTNTLPSSMPLGSGQPTSSGGPNGGNTFARPRGPARRPVGGRVAAARSAFEAANQ
ncbi:Protein tyrosine kinase 9/actin monomer-binding protein [Phaffia rhodozyma]|uniref:Protein tyrosine kinase 9/actin monomer-binding protein n=1 Tax=Phaffia rhodozyma TaxID=264483 RepID=A0A0F7SM94_PHARH|nr:Protein tyrosine kinase 9/actin monomer-binding protein [Phaffia rhodozyma]